MPIQCPYCGGRGCLVCDAWGAQQAQQDVQQAIVRRQEAEALEFLTNLLRDPKKPDAPIDLDPQLVTLVARAIEHGKESVRASRQTTEPGISRQRRFSHYLEFDTPAPPWSKAKRSG